MDQNIHFYLYISELHFLCCSSSSKFEHADLPSGKEIQKIICSNLKTLYELILRLTAHFRCLWTISYLHTFLNNIKWYLKWDKVQLPSYLKLYMQFLKLGALIIVARAAQLIEILLISIYGLLQFLNCRKVQYLFKKFGFLHIKLYNKDISDHICCSTVLLWRKCSLENTSSLLMSPQAGNNGGAGALKKECAAVSWSSHYNPRNS